MLGFQGVFASAITPRRGDEIDLGALLEVIDFLCRAQVSGITLFDAAGEFVHFTTADRRKLFNLAIRRSRAPVIAGVSHSTLDGASELGDAAMRANAAALLIAPPCFYPYTQADIREFFLRFARDIDGGAPILLHNLPLLATPLEPSTAADLLRTGLFEGVVDASGDAEWLRSVRRLAPRPFASIVGNDGAFVESRFDGAAAGLSAVAGVVPELMLALHTAVQENNGEAGEALRPGLNSSWIGPIACRSPPPFAKPSPPAASSPALTPSPLPRKPPPVRPNSGNGSIPGSRQ